MIKSLLEELLMEDDSLGSTCIEFILKNRLCGKKVFFSRVEVYTEQIADIERSRTIADKEKIKESSKTRED